MQTGFVDFVSEQEQAIELAKYLDKVKTVKAQQTGSEAPASTLLSQCTQLVKESKFLDVLVNLVKESGDLFVAGVEKDVESFFCLFISLLSKLGAEKVLSTQDAILSTITADPTQKPALRLAVLNNLYNGVLDQNWRFAFLKAIFSVVRASKQYEALNPIYDTLDERLSQHFSKLSAAQRREILLTASELAREGKYENALAVHVKYLKSFEGAASEAELSGASKHAVALVSDALLTPNVFQFDDLINSAVVKALGTKADTKPIFELLQIFSSQNYDAFAKFLAAHKSVVEQLGANAEEVLTRKIRLLTVVSVTSAAFNAAAAAASVAAPAASGEAASVQATATYASIASALQVSEDDVESWVIDAVTEELIEAKLNQLHNTVHVTYALQRSFDMSNWKHISDKLALWKENIRGMIKTLHAARDTTLAVEAQ